MTPADIHAWRTRLGLTQAELAARMGVDTVTWNRWERGRQTPRYPVMLERSFRDLERELEALAGSS